jgi:phage/plasmid-associated DNA primase
MYHSTSVHELKCNSDSQFGLGALLDENIKFVYMSETSKQLPWGVSVLNTMIEGQQTELRVMRKDPVTRTTTFTMAFAANPDQVPSDWIKDPRQGIRRRLAVFEFMIQPEKSDSELIVKLMREEELAKMFVKFNRMYLLGRAYFDAIRL